MNNNIGLNLYIIPTTYYIVTILDEVGVWESIREKVNY